MTDTKKDKETPAKKAPAKKKPATAGGKPLTAAEKAAVEAKEKVRKAEAEAKKLKAEADKKAKKAQAEAAKVKKAADKKAEQEKLVKAVERELASHAKAANVRLDKAAKLFGQADDHRLAAAIELSEAKERCREAKINYGEWCKENIHLGYESVRKLLPIGDAERATEGAGALMLTDMRNKNKAANKKAREKKKATDEQKKAHEGSTGDTSTKPKATPFDKAMEGLKGMDKATKQNFLESQSQEAGLVVHKESNPKPTDRPARVIAEEAFGKMGAKAKVAFANWVAEQVGGKFVMDEAKETK